MARGLSIAPQSALDIAARFDYRLEAHHEKTVYSMSETVRFFVLQSTLLAVVLVLHTYIGLHVVRRTLIFSDLVLDQLAAFGGLVGVGLGLHYGAVGAYLISLAAVLVGALLLALVKPRNPLIPREAVIGIMYGLALTATLLLGDKITGGGAYVTKSLSGAMLWASWPLVAVTTGVYLLLLLFHWKFRARFLALVAQPEHSENSKLWDFLFFVTQGIITVLIVPIAGVLLAYAFLMIPAAIAAMFTKAWGRAVVLGWSVGFVGCLSGLSASYYFNLPYGPTLVLALGVFFLGAVVLRALFPAAVRTS